MFENKKIVVYFIAILLSMGYGFIFPISIYAVQRSKHSIDSIAYATLNHDGVLYGALNNKPSLTKILLRSSELNKMNSKMLGGNEAFYVYGKSTESRGFVIVSADERMPDVLAYSHDETFLVDSMPASTRYWLECYIDNYFNLDSLNSKTEEPCLQSATIQPNGVEPILGSLPWGQSDPYNRLCPLSSLGKCVTGCVATAMSQVMWTYKWPVCGKGNIEFNTHTYHIRVKMNLADHPFRWDLIKEDYQRGKYSEDEANAVATLMAACGAAVHMDYAPDGSGAFQEDILKALINNFYYDPDAAFLSREYFTSVDWNSLLISELNEGRAVNYAGQSRTDGGHSFVIDGYEAESSETNPYYHLNWGWNGQCNGYYILPELLPKENGRHYVEEGFSTGQQMLIGVHPDDGEVEANKMLLVEGLKVIQAHLKPGEASVLRIDKIANFCYRTFRGQIALQLYSEKGDTFIIEKTQIDDIPFLESQSNINISFVIPDTFEEGKYTVKLVGINGDGLLTEMYSRSFPQIIVSNNPYGDEESESLTLLCASEFEVFKLADQDSVLNMRVYELFNYSDDLQKGDLQLELATEDGTSIMTMGTSVWHPELESQGVESSPVTLLGSIPNTLSNGKYRLYVLFYPSGQSISNRVKFYDRATPEDVPVEYFLPMEVKDNLVTVNGISFGKNPTVVQQPISANINQTPIFSIYGVKTSKLHKGINIVKFSNGSYRKTYRK